MSTAMNNSPAIHYDQLFGPLFFEPYALEVAKRIDSIPVSTVLEIAAGTDVLPVIYVTVFPSRQN